MHDCELGLTKDHHPHSVSASPIHLSPCPGERKGAERSGWSFLSPVERGRGGARSATEWGSTNSVNPSSGPWAQ
jgi:hypothetical protein